MCEVRWATEWPEFRAAFLPLAVPVLKPQLGYLNMPCRHRGKTLPQTRAVKSINGVALISSDTVQSGISATPPLEIDFSNMQVNFSFDWEESLREFDTVLHCYLSMPPLANQVGH